MGRTFAIIYQVCVWEHVVLHIFTGYTFVRQFPVLHFPPLQICPSFSSPAFSTPWNFFFCHFPVLQIQRPHYY